MTGLGRRVLTAAVLLPPVLFLISLGPWGLAPLLAAFAVLGAREFVRLLGGPGPAHPPWIAAGSGVLLIVSWGGLLPLGVPAALVLIMLAAIVGGFLRRRGSMLSGLAVALVGSIYLGFLPGYLLRFYAFGREGTADPWPVYYALVLVWGCDTAAYLVGSQIGRHRLWPRVSPSKSWEGAAAGVVGATMLAVGLGGWVPGLTLAGRLGAGLLVGVSAQVGDLAESMMKREADLKDSGRMLPGHGGLLDRLDSLILAAPILYYWLRWSLTIPS
jgi:phosphatidate cytidylyltransferase